MSRMHEMKFMEVVHLVYEDYEILRVPGGWVVTNFAHDGAGGRNASSCFVPFSTEFEQDKEQEQ